MALQTDGNGVTVPNWAPATRLVAITKSDSTDLTDNKIRALWVGGAGDVAVLAIGDSAAVTLSAVPAGSIVPVMVKKVMSTNTSASLIVGLI